MSQKVIFVPMLAHMLLVFFLFIKLGIEKKKAVKLGLVDRKKAALNSNLWPDDVVKVSNNIANQFETPMMFYGLSFTLFLTNNVNMVVMLLTSFYVATRCFHTYFHISNNYVPYRLRAFLMGILVLLALTVWQLIQLLFST